jgi:hypothetical protein
MLAHWRRNSINSELLRSLILKKLRRSLLSFTHTTVMTSIREFSSVMI